MIRSISLAAILAAAFALPVLAQDSTIKSPPAAAVQAVAASHARALRSRERV
jgi:hypothetical protein